MPVPRRGEWAGRSPSLASASRALSRRPVVGGASPTPVSCAGGSGVAREGGADSRKLALEGKAALPVARDSSPAREGCCAKGRLNGLRERGVL